LFKSRVIVRHLSGNLIFKGISVMDWLLLHEYISLNLKSPEQEYFASLCGILRMSSGTRKGVLRSFWSRTRPIQKKLNGIRLHGKDVQGGFADLRRFLQIPERCLDTQSLYTMIEVCWKNQQPRQLSRVGVGYKDKGSLGSVYFVEPPASEEILSDFFVEETLCKLWSSISHFA
jgi:hypothetical protein